MIEVDTIKTKIVTSDDVKEAGRIIRGGGLVAFPTETVYGLGADAMNSEAAAKIYAAKGRPSDNPLIVHISDLESLYAVAEDIPAAALKIMDAFWPGPLTVILKKKKGVPDGTTGGLATVAVRMPSHPLALRLIRESGRVIAAPSANLSGRPSPTTAAHVMEDLGGRIPLILDGGPVGIGIESTILDMTGETPTILRPGYITRQRIEAVIGLVITDPAVSGRTAPEHVEAKAPGMKYRHYSPRGELILVEGEKEKVIAEINALAEEKERGGYRVGVLATDETLGFYHAGRRLSLGSRKTPETIAANLYDRLRQCDAQGFDYIFSESFFEENLGDALMNRMLKAAGYHLITL